MTEHETLALTAKIFSRKTAKKRARRKRMSDIAEFCAFTMLKFGLFNFAIAGPVVYFWILGESDFSAQLWMGLTAGPILLIAVFAVLAVVLEPVGCRACRFHSMRRCSSNCL